MDMDVYSIRKANLEKALQQRNATVADFAKQTGVSAIYLTQVLSAKTQRRMGDKVARRIENKAEFPAGWLDMMDAPIASLSNRAIELAHKFDKLPEAVQQKIELEIEILYRFSGRE
jgi:transcriptional regulator with XRE-family HTH domain